MTIGIIGKNNDKGLGTLTRQYLKFLPITHAVFVEDKRTKKDLKGTYCTRPEDHIPDVDVLIVLEMARPELFKRCREKGIKTILKVNYEFLPERLEHEPDLYLCSSSLNYEAITSDNKVLIPDPVDLDEIATRNRERCHTFVHNGGTLGVGGANGTQEVIEALKYTSKPFSLILRAQVPIQCHDPRVDLRIGSIPFTELYEEGDVFVLPQKFRATSLPLQEAMASGMPTLCSDIKPFNEYVTYTFPVHKYTEERLSRPIQYAHLDPKEIAKQLDALYDSDILEASEQAIEFGKSISWQSLAPKYIELCEKL